MEEWRQKFALLLQYGLQYIVNFCWSVNITLPVLYTWSNDVMLKMMAMVMMMMMLLIKKKKKNAYKIKWLWRTLRYFRLLPWK
jgi:hypothetical protein